MFIISHLALEWVFFLHFSGFILVFFATDVLLPGSVARRQN
jgi:hypothetical protein